LVGIFFSKSEVEFLFSSLLAEVEFISLFQQYKQFACPLAREMSGNFTGSKYFSFSDSNAFFRLTGNYAPALEQNVKAIINSMEKFPLFTIQSN
jgi:hypothetical protein